MSLILKSNPVGVDVPINKIQNDLYTAFVTNGTWTKYASYHRAYKNETTEGIRPEVFGGITNGNKESDYKEVFMNDDFNVTSFFLVPDDTPVTETGFHTPIISLIFQVDLSKIYPTAPHRFDEEFRNEVVNVLEALPGDFHYEGFVTSISDVYAGLDTSKVNWDDMQKFHVVRFEIGVNYAFKCNNTFSIAMPQDIDASLFIAAAGITETVQKDAINELVLELKANSLWTKFIAIYPYVGGTALQHSYNLSDPDTFQMTWAGGITHSSTGVLGNAVNGWGDTGINISSDISQDDNNFGVFSATQDVASTGVDIGARDGSNVNFDIEIRFGGNRFYTNMHTGFNPGVSDTVTNELFVNTRNASGSFKAYKGATEEQDNTKTSVAAGSVTLAVLALNNNGTAAFFSDREQALAFAGTGLSADDVTNFESINQKYQAAVR